MKPVFIGTIACLPNGEYGLRWSNDRTRRQLKQTLGEVRAHDVGKRVYRVGIPPGMGPFGGDDFLQVENAEQRDNRLISQNERLERWRETP